MNRTAKSVIVAAIVLVVLDRLAASELRQRWLLVVAVLSFTILLVRQRGWLLRVESRVPVLLALIASFVPVFAIGVFEHPDRVLAVTAELIPALIGWCVLLTLTLFITEDKTAIEAMDWKFTRFQGALALGAVFILLAVVHYLAVGDVALVSDEVLYLTQSRWIKPGQWTAAMEPDLAPFFVIRQIDYLGGHLVGQYPAGWPMVLAVFRMLGLEWWSSVILGTASVWLLYALGKKLYSRQVGVIAALLMATSMEFLVTHAGYMAHAAAVTSLLAATLLLLHGLDRRRWRRVLYWVGAGAFLGIVVAARPLTGLTVGTSVGLWMLARTWNVERRAIGTMIGALCVGGLLPGALLIAHNVAVTGGPFVLGYEAIHHDLYRLGFGTHGFMVLDETLNRIPLTFEFTPKDAAEWLIARLAGLNTKFLPVGLLMPVLAAALATGYRIRWPIIAAFALLPLAHFFHQYSHLRLYIELLPFLLIAVATMLVAVSRRWPSLATGLVVMVLLSQVLITVPVPGNRPAASRPWDRSDYGPRAPARRKALASVDSLTRQHGRILLFSREASRFDNLIDRLYVLNDGNFNGPVLVARDRRERNVELIRRHPDRVPFLIIDNHGSTPATISRIEER